MVVEAKKAGKKMTTREIRILNSLVTYTAEHVPGGLTADEREVAQIVGQWALDGVPVRPVCPHCGSVAPYGEERHPWLRVHIESEWHRLWWNLRQRLHCA